ncbi:MAG: tRNA (adenosine(37)-N6)-threonylcarbamoyltransferase complex ATPase subunit type 1 TsaE [Ruminococcaceae bacterium]|nr:tRNA (adenosine(37)-N6)-threonylcarbamoyltransferase complex ATPase subunit type 1 TsaE [Oscillospiraceae bacterium]
MILAEKITHSRLETEMFAEGFAKTVKGGSVLAMKGDLGAGKTCFTYGFAKGMGYLGDVCSPTFAIVNEYHGGRLPIYHFDMYRVSGWDDLYTTGYFEALESGGVLVIEWSENIEAALPEDCITVIITKIDENTRKIVIEKEGEP